MMQFFLAEIASSNWPSFFAICAAVVGFIGCAAAVMAMRQVHEERRLIESTKSKLVSPESWEEVYSHSDHALTSWLSKLGIKPDSGVSDVILTCWSAWLGARPPTLNEIHVLVARRERSKLSVRLSGDIAALLLVIGIAGTLWSVKPILESFDFKTSIAKTSEAEEAGRLVGIDEKIEHVNQLMQNLGGAFLPSLAALIATITVASLRGFYSLGLHRYTLEMDRFAIGTVMPRFRPKSLSEEFADVRSTFDSLAKSIQEREQKFESVVQGLLRFTENLEPTLKCLETGMGKMASAAEALESKSHSVASTLTRTLGKKSPLYEAVEGFDGIFKRAITELNLLSNIALKLTKNEDFHHKALVLNIEKLYGVVLSLQDGCKISRDDILTTVQELKNLIANFPKEAVTQATEVFDRGLSNMGAQVRDFVSTESAAAERARAEIQKLAEHGTLSLMQAVSDLDEQTKSSLEKLSSTIQRAESFLDDATKSSERPDADGTNEPGESENGSRKKWRDILGF